jgi:hypothetical protein
MNPSAELIYPDYLPARLFGVPVHNLPDKLKTARNNAVHACFVEAAFCLLCLPLGAVRGGLAKLNLAINVILMTCGTLGCWASLGFRINWVMAHCALV